MLRNLIRSEIWSCACIFSITLLLPSTATHADWNSKCRWYQQKKEKKTACIREIQVHKLPTGVDSLCVTPSLLICIVHFDWLLGYLFWQMWGICSYMNKWILDWGFEIKLKMFFQVHYLYLRKRLLWINILQFGQGLLWC